jgi:glutathione S-transferase
MAVLKILGRKTSSNVQKVLWCCGELGVAFERMDIGGQFGGNKAPDYLALNPNGLVPTIDDEGFVLWESNVIVRYLAAKYAAAGTLYPADLVHRADAERWMDWQQTTVGPPMGILFRGLLRAPPDAIENAELKNAERKAGAALAILDAQLARHDYVAGGSLTVADIALGYVPHRWFKLPIDRVKLPHLKRWYERLCDRPEYQKHVVDA